MEIPVRVVVRGTPERVRIGDHLRRGWRAEIHPELLLPDPSDRLFRPLEEKQLARREHPSIPQPLDSGRIQSADLLPMGIRRWPPDERPIRVVGGTDNEKGVEAHAV
jgi:hypothetical protein